jgi:3-isopropylmalate/(R)-2-methylmalate dehydratase small subunit
VLPQEAVAALMDATDKEAGSLLGIDLEGMTVTGAGLVTPFDMSERHRRMFLEGLDLIGSSLQYQPQIDAFAAAHWASQPWLKDTARLTRDRLGQT